MPRRIEISLPADATDELLDRIAGLDGVVGVRVERGTSIRPAGDVITVDATNPGALAVARVLSERGIGAAAGSSFSTSEPTSMVSAVTANALARDSSESTWEEMELAIAKESNATPFALVVMAISGITATVGLATNALHLVIGAMLIAPGFEPITRIALGVATGTRASARGLADLVRGYASLALAAAGTGLVLTALGVSPLASAPSYLPAGSLVSYWTSISPSSLVVAGAASLAGAVLVVTNRSVLTAGVMVALALVPTAAIAGFAVAGGDLQLAFGAAARWAVEVVIVGVAGLAVFAAVRARRGRPRGLL